jgi:hypothetical protein
MRPLLCCLSALLFAAPSAPAAQVKPTQQAPQGPAAPKKWGRFDLDAQLPELAKGQLSACAAQLQGPSGHADCDVATEADRITRVQLAWDDARPGAADLIALRLSFDPAVAPAMTDLEWQLTRAWGAPGLEQLRRERNHKLFTLQWEDGEHRATLEAGAPVTQPSRAISLTFERKPPALPGDLASLKPRPFPGFHLRWVKRVDWSGGTFAVVYGSSLSPAQEALGEAGPHWAGQRNYVGVWQLEPPQGDKRHRWRPLWDRVAGGSEEDDDPQRVLHVDVRDVTGDGTPDVLIEFSCDTCNHKANEIVLKTVRAGKLVDLLVKRDLFRATVELDTGRVRIREPEDREDGRPAATVSTYAYDRSKGAFVLAREEHVEN